MEGDSPRTRDGKLVSRSKGNQSMAVDDEQKRSSNAVRKSASHPVRTTREEKPLRLPFKVFNPEARQPTWRIPGSAEPPMISKTTAKNELPSGDVGALNWDAAIHVVKSLWEGKK